MMAMSTRWAASAPMVAPTSSTMLSPRIVGQMAAMAGRSTCAMVLRQILAIAMSAPVLPAETAASASPVAHRLHGPPHGRLAAPGADRLARLVVHAHRHLGMADLDRALQARVRLDERRDGALVAEHEEAQGRMPLERQRRARHDDRGAVIAAHGVERDTHWL